MSIETADPTRTRPTYTEPTYTMGRTDRETQRLVQQAPLDTLAARIQAEVASSQSPAWLTPLVGAWARKPW